MAKELIESIRIPADKMTLHHHCSYYDHPLNGVCIVNGRWWWFDRAYGSRWAECRPMATPEKVKRSLKHLLFVSLVGGHTTYSGGKRAHSVVRQPRWLWRRLATVYYRGIIGIIKPIF